MAKADIQELITQTVPLPRGGEHISAIITSPLEDPREIQSLLQENFLRFGLDRKFLRIINWSRNAGSKENGVLFPNSKQKLNH